MDQLLKKYNLPAPRYTSYPTVPHWKNNLSREDWLKDVHNTFNQQHNWAMYVHIPFCHSLCHYCGCNRIISKSHKNDFDYVQALIEEWNIYLKSTPKIKESPLKSLHLGGGTPTFLSAEHLSTLIDALLDQQNINTDSFEGSIEVDPRRTSVEQLSVLKSKGFNRISLGVQDFNENVQYLIHRSQSFEQTQMITDSARQLGYDSVNFDLIYGLPQQGLEEIQFTIDQTLKLKPDRIALYSLAIVPWFNEAQRRFKDEDLPNPDEKRKLYELARSELSKAGYIDIGMDHFSLPADSLYVAHEEKRLHRNFMGYTDVNTDVLLGIGVSSISETPTSYCQNFKTIDEYKQSLTKKQLPTLKGHSLTDFERKIKQQILQLTTQYETEFLNNEQKTKALQYLKPYIADQLVSINGNVLSVLEKGHPLVRLICMSIDPHIQTDGDGPRFSKAI